ncbi:MAG: sigma-70 family RNA polymerase sigma factor [Candidatus Riflebacteria bacterium]|nr:sigma-70 family RNA polymerase sigma factor [Candidatus Riflebacteria bacterium]
MTFLRPLPAMALGLGALAGRGQSFWPPPGRLILPARLDRLLVCLSTTLHQTIRELDDPSLIRMAGRGHREYFSPLIERYGRLVRVAIWHFFHDQRVVEDLSQEAFAKAFTQLGSLRNPDRFKPWILQIAVRLCHDHYRQRDPALETEDIERFADTLPDETRSAFFEDSEVLQLWRGLPPQDAQLIWLRVVEDLGYAEIAQITGLQEPAIRQRISRGLRRLREDLT